MKENINRIQYRNYGEIEKQTVGIEGFFERGSELMYLFSVWGWGRGAGLVQWGE